MNDPENLSNHRFIILHKIKVKQLFIILFCIIATSSFSQNIADYYLKTSHNFICPNEDFRCVTYGVFLELTDKNNKEIFRVNYHSTSSNICGYWIPECGIIKRIRSTFKYTKGYLLDNGLIYIFNSGQTTWGQ